MQKSQPVGAQAVAAYGTQRGTAGATGASARDFAAQSQGLSGVVRLYATIAANVYAVTAAFGVLSRAMDTSNMVSGLTQLGAASGKNLGGLSKQLKEVTGGAISTREAMEAVTKASTSGLGSANILRLGAVAQKASGALGLNMSDAISRLTRGITKLEPELLDELGIFTKIEPAVEKYARSVGKASGQLTDFERRQAFALAVLEEGEQKFGKINIDVNPYTKLSASFADLMQKTLEFVNVGLIPLINLLNSNPVILLTTLTLIGNKVLKNLIPQLSDVKAGLDNIASKSREKVIAKGDTALAGLLPDITKSRAEIDKRNETFYDMYAKGREALLKRLGKLGPLDPKTLEVLNKIPGETTGEDLKYIKSRLSRSKADKSMFLMFKEGARGSKETDEEIVANQKQINQIVNKNLSVYERYFTAKGRMQKDADAAQRASVSAEIINNAAKKASTDGLLASIKQVWSETKKAGQEQTLQKTLVGTTASGKEFQQVVSKTIPTLGLFRQAGVGIAGTITAIGTSLAGLAGAFLKVLPYIGLVVGAFEFLKSLWSTSEKQAQKFSKATDSLNSALESVDNTLEYIKNLKPDQIFTIDTVQAQATALDGLTVAFAEVAKSAEELSKSKGSVDTFFGNLYQIVEKIPVAGSIITKIFGSSDKATLAKQVSEDVTKALQLVQAGPARDKLQKEFAKALGVSPDVIVDKEKLNAALGDLRFEELAGRAKKAAESQKQFSQETSVSAAKLTELRSSLQETSKQVDSYVQGLMPTDPFSKLGISLLDNSLKLKTALQEPGKEILALQETISDTKVLALLPPDLSQQLLQAQDQVKTFLDGIKNKNLEIKLIDEQIEAARKENNKNQLKDLEKIKNIKQSELKNIESAASSFSKTIGNTLQKGLFTAALKNFDIATKMAADSAAITQKRAGLSVLESAGVDTSASENRLKQQEFAIQSKLVTAQVELAIAIYRMKAATEYNAAVSELNTKALERGRIAKDNIPNDPRLAKLDEDWPKVVARVETATKEVEILKGSSSEIVKSLKTIGTTGGSSAEQAAAANLIGLLPQLSGAVSQLSAILGQAGAARIEGGAKEIVKGREVGFKGLETGAKITSDLLKDIQQEEKLKGVYDEQLAAKRKVADLATILNQAAQEQYKLDTNIAVLNYALAKANLGDAEKTKTNAELKRLNAEKERIDKSKVAEMNRVDQNATLEFLAAEKEKLEKRQQLESTNSQLDIERTNLQLDLAERNLQILSSIDGIDKRILNTERARIDILKVQSQAAQEALAIKQQEEQLQFRQLELNRKKQVSPQTDFTPLQAQLDAENVVLQSRKALQQDSAKQKQDDIEATKNLANEQETYNKILETTKSISEGLQSSFQNMTDSAKAFVTGLGSVITSLVEIGRTTSENKKAELAFQEQLTDARVAYGAAIGDPKKEKQASEQIAKAEQNISNITKKSQRDEIAGYGKLAGAAKTMFKEKTGAYKAFAAFEKAMHILSVAMKVKEMFFDDAATAKKVVNDGVKQTSDTAAAGTSGVRAIIDVMKGLPLPLALAAGAAMAAVVAGLMSSIGGSSPSVSMPGAPTAQEKKETVGTAQFYNSDNQLEQYRPGVLGDASARSEVFTKSLDLMNANSVESLAYSYKMVTALLAIKAGINNLAGVFKTARGLSVGSAFGTKEGVTKGGNVFTTRTREVDIERSGIKVSGSIFDLRDNVLSAARAFEEGVVKTSSSTFGLFKNNNASAFLNEQTLEQALGPVAAKRLSNALNKTFGNAIDLSMQIGNRMGLTDQQIVNMMNSVVIDPLREGLLDLRDVPIADQPAIIESWAAGIVDKVTAPFLAGFEKYANENAEDLTQIAIRTITQYDNANQLLKQMPGFEGIDKAVGNDLFRGIDISQGLIDTFGGYEQFAESMNEFNSSILTEQEQQANKQKMVQAAMKNAGLEDVTTMEKFREVYKKALTDMTSTDQTLAASATQLVHDMVAIGPAFKEVGTQASEMIKKLEDSFKLTKDATKGILLEVFKTAKDAAEAQTLAQEKAAKLVYDSIIETATDAISTQLFDVAIKPLMDSVVAASAQAAASTIAGGVTAGTAVAAGGMIAKDALEKAVNQARATITAMSEIMKDPEFQNALQSVTGSIGTFAADMYMTLPGAGSESSSSKFELSKFLEELNKEIDNANKQIRQLGMTSYEKALDDINVKTEAYAKQLRDAAVPSAAATDAIKAFTEAQIALLKAQNEAKATEIIKNLKQQMSDALLSPFGKELVANTRQAQDYAKQLRDINQSTNDNIRTLNEWENANRERIINTGIEQQNKAYDELFKTSTATAQGAQKLSNKFVALNLQMPKSATDLKTLVDGFKYTTVESIELRGKVIELAQEFNAAFTTLSDAVRSAYDARVQELTGARDEFKQFATSIRDFKQSLLLSAESPLSPLEKYTKAQAEYVKVRDLAESGDKVAMGKLESVSQAFLEQSRGMFAGTESYVRDFNDVIKALDNTESAAELQMHAAIDSLAGIRETVSSLIRLEEINKESNVILQGLGPTLQTAVDNLALYTGYTNLPELAVGTNYVPDNMVAKIHKGERVIPAADNAKLMTKLQQDEVLVKEVQQLNKQMAQLTQVVAQGATINNNSTNQNTEEIVKAVDGLEKALVYFQKVQSKAMIV
jgi:hypothetical protein